MSNQNINSNNAMNDEEYARLLQEQFFADGPEQLASENNGGNVHNEQNNMQAGKDGDMLVEDFIKICDQYETADDVNNYLLEKIPSLAEATKYSPRDVNHILEKVDIGKFRGVNNMYNIFEFSEETLGSVPGNLSPKYIEFLFLESGSYSDKSEKKDSVNVNRHEKFCQWVCNFMINYVKKISNAKNKSNMKFENDEIIKTFFFDLEGNKRKKSDVIEFLGADKNILQMVINNQLNTDFIIYLLQNKVGLNLEDDFLLTCSDLLQEGSYINKLLDGKIKSDEINFTNEKKTRVQAIKNIVLDIDKILKGTGLASVKEYKNVIDGLLKFKLNIDANEDETRNFIQRAKSALDLLKTSELIYRDAGNIDEFFKHNEGSFAKIYDLAQSDFVKCYMVEMICELSLYLRFTVFGCFLEVFKSLKENTFADNEEKQRELKKLFIKALIVKFKDKEVGSCWTKSLPIKDILECKYRFDTEKSNEGKVFGQDSGLSQSDWEYFYCCCSEFGVDINKYWPGEKDVEYKNRYENEMKLALEKNKKPEENEIKDENSQIKEYEQKLIIDLLAGEFDAPAENVNPEINNNVNEQVEVKIKDNEAIKNNKEDNVDVKENQDKNEKQIPEENNPYRLTKNILKDINDCVDKMVLNENNICDDFITDLNRIASRAENADTRQKSKGCFIDVFFQKYIEKIAADDKELFVVKMLKKFFSDHKINFSDVDNYLDICNMHTTLVNRRKGEEEYTKGLLDEKGKLFVKIKEQLKGAAQPKESLNVDNKQGQNNNNDPISNENNIFVDEADIDYFMSEWDKAVQKYNEKNKSEQNVEKEDEGGEGNNNQDINNPKQDEELIEETKNELVQEDDQHNQDQKMNKKTNAQLIYKEREPFGKDKQVIKDKSSKSETTRKKGVQNNYYSTRCESNRQQIVDSSQFFADRKDVFKGQATPDHKQVISANSAITSKKPVSLIHLESNNQMDKTELNSNVKLYFTLFVISVIVLAILLALTLIISLSPSGKAIFVAFDVLVSGAAIYNGVQSLRFYSTSNKPVSIQTVIDTNTDKKENLNVDEAKKQILSNENVSPATDNSEKEKENEPK